MAGLDLYKEEDSIITNNFIVRLFNSFGKYSFVGLISAGFFVLSAALLVGGFSSSPSYGEVLPSQTSTCTGTFKHVSAPLTELGNSNYVRMSGQIYTVLPGTNLTVGGGLYPNGLNERPVAHTNAGINVANSIVPLNSNGNPDPNGSIVLLSIGMSNTSKEFLKFIELADQDSSVNPRLLLVNGAQSGKTASEWSSSSVATPWQVAKDRLESSSQGGQNGITPDQVQVIWLKQANNMDYESTDFPTHSLALLEDLKGIVRHARVNFPNLKMIFVSSRTRSYDYWDGESYTFGALNPEPAAFETGFSAKWLVEQQITGDDSLNYDPESGPVSAPWLSWGPYLWVDSSPRADGFSWTSADLARDCTHPSESGEQKVAEQLMAFFKNDVASKPWFIGEPVTAEETPPTEVDSPPASICGDGVCSEDESCSTCNNDCGVCSIQESSCGNGVCEPAEACETCSEDCGLCPDVTWEPPVLSCPSGTTEIGFFEGYVQSRPNGRNVNAHSVNLSDDAKITVVGYAGEGHPETCPDGPYCTACPDGGACGEPAQDKESFGVYIDGENFLGEYVDSGLDSDTGWYLLPEQPWVSANTYAQGSHNVVVKHSDIGHLPSSSVSYGLKVCEEADDTSSGTSSIEHLTYREFRRLVRTWFREYGFSPALWIRIMRFRWCLVNDLFGQNSKCDSLIGVIPPIPPPGEVVCGDGMCSVDESCSTCVADCGTCETPPAPVCGDGECNGGESCETCEGDCGVCPPPPGPVCGDGVCIDSETCETCLEDCGECTPPAPVCGDGECNGDETCETCSADCGACGSPGPICGDGICNGDETCETCEGDCGICPPIEPTCGDGDCNGDETCETCESDCGICGVPAVCELTSATWASTEAVEGETVSLTITGTNCDGETLEIVVKEEDTLINDSVDNDPANAVFSGSTATSSWVAEYQCDGALCLAGDPEYIFEAVLVSTSAEITSSNTLTVSEAETPVPPPDDGTSACTHYVSLLGSNSNNGTSLDRAFRTISYGANAVNYGDVVCVEGGTYVEEPKFETAGVTIRALDMNNKPVIDGEYSIPTAATEYTRCNTAISPQKCHNWGHLVRISADDVTFQGFRVMRSLGRGVVVYKSNTIVRNSKILDNEIVHNRNAGIFFTGSDGVLIEGNDISFSADVNAEGSDSEGAFNSNINWPAAVTPTDSRNYVFRDNIVHNNYTEGMHTNGGPLTDNILNNIGTTDLLIEDNVFYDNSQLGGVYIHKSDNATIQRNLVYCTNDARFRRGGNPPQGIVMNNEANFTYSTTDDYVDVINNIVVGCRHNFAVWGNEDNNGFNNVLVANNTFVNAVVNDGTTSNVSLGSYDAAVNNFRFENNIVHESNSSNPLIATNSGSIYDFSNNLFNRNPPSWAGEGSIVDTNSLVNADAAITSGDVNPENYKLRSDSSAIDEGVSTVVNDKGEPEVDFFGSTRDSQYDIGAHEHNGTVIQPPAPATCDITSASWARTTAVEGETVAINVTGSDCAGESISFVVKESDPLLNDSVGTNPATVVFSGNSATSSWVAEYQCDGAFCLAGDPEYVFEATSGSVTVTSSNVLTVSEEDTAPPPPPDDGTADCTHYVSVSGNDNNVGTSLSSAFRTIDHGADSMNAGEVLCVEGGTYVEQVTVDSSGTVFNPVTIRALDYSDKPVIDGQYTIPNIADYACNTRQNKCFNYGNLVQIRGDHVIFEGFEITRSKGRGLTVNKSDQELEYVTIKDNNIHHNRKHGLHVHTANNIEIIGNEIHHNEEVNAASSGSYDSNLNWGAGLTHSYASYVTVKDNKVHDNWGEGILFDANWTNSNHAVIEGNESYNNYSTNLYLHRAQYVVARNNLLYCTPDREIANAWGESLKLHNERESDSGNTLNNIDVVNNIMFGCPRTFAIGTGTDSNGNDYRIDNVNIINNMIANARPRPTGSNEVRPVTIRPGSNTSNIQVRNNIIYQDELYEGTADVPNNFPFDYINGSVTYSNNLWSHEPVSGVRGSGGIVSDPLFVNLQSAYAPGNATTTDFMLSSGSPAIDSGVGISTSAWDGKLLQEDDYYGNLRTDGQIDIGVHEYGGSGGTPPSDPVCGDGSCNGTETCTTCAQDCGACSGGGDLDKTGLLYGNYLEWSVSNPSYSGNPFDLVATVTFNHSSSGETHETEMFYSGGNTWKFRFTGTQLGTWTFSSSSFDSDLSGLAGTVTINSNPNPNHKGFVVANGDRWARSNGDHFVPQFVMYDNPSYFGTNTSLINRDLDTYLGDLGFNGLHILLFCRWFEIDTPTCYDFDPINQNPSFETFDALDVMLTQVYNRGGTIHFWQWGDTQRGLTPDAMLNGGGVNNTADRRLQRYIAARLGPLPGWTMGYGFDVWEWSNESRLTSWHDYMQDHFGWIHLLGARSQKNALTQLSEAMGYSGYEQHRPDYWMYVRTINTRDYKPSFSEDRFRIRPADDPYAYKNYEMYMIRRGLYHSTMAGGVANIWGDLRTSGDAGNLGADMSGTFPNPEQIKTYSTFWENRYLNNMTICSNANIPADFPYPASDSLSSNAYCYATPSRDKLVFYIEDASSMNIDLPGSGGSYPIVAVDTKLSYSEISPNSGATVSANSQNVSFPYTSDWVVAIGNW